MVGIRAAAGGGRISTLVDALPSSATTGKSTVTDLGPKGQGVRRSSSEGTSASVASSNAVAPSSSSGGGRRGKDDAQSETVGGTKDAGKERTLITTALRTLERDMALLDDVASLQTQLSSTEVGLLLGAIAASGVGPIFFPGTSVTEVLAPAAAACEWRIFVLSYFLCRIS